MICEEKLCTRCGYVYNIEVHHCIHGNGRRKLADEDGLTVYMCHDCHMELHANRKIDLEYIMLGQIYYEKRIGTREQFRERYGKSWLK